MTTGWQRPARHRQERPVLRVVASRFLPEVVTLSIWGIMVRSPAPEQDRPRESVSTDRFHACINVHCRVPQWTRLFSSSCRDPLSNNTAPEYVSNVHARNRSLFDHTFSRIVTYHWTSYPTFAIAIDISSFSILFNSTFHGFICGVSLVHYEGYWI